jgi:type III restriction enzyme
VLALDRFRLRDQLEMMIEQHRRNERRAAFQSFLLPESPLAVEEAVAINFKLMAYEPGWRYEGGFRFQKHYFGPKPGELLEKTPKGTIKEEFKCAQFLDDFPAVEFWVRNLSNKDSSFRLQTSTDWFYPDFVCQLKDGRTLAVESKGEHLAEGRDAEEKQMLGKLWESRSNGRCLFVMSVAGDFSEIVKACWPVKRPGHVFVEHDLVKLTQACTEEGTTFPPGIVGTVVSVYRNGEAYAVELERVGAPPVVAIIPGEALEPSL